MQYQQQIQDGTVSPGAYPNSIQHTLERLNQGERSVVYGLYGMNRWFVAEDGSVSFSEGHASSQDTLKRVRELGFEIE